jgi:hypothetical protein
MLDTRSSAMRAAWSLAAAGTWLTATFDAAAAECAATMGASKDNTLIEVADGSRSNALGDGIFTGRTNFFGGFTLRRAVIAFDVAAAIPPGATITDVTLHLYLLQSSPTSGTQTLALHRILADWGEGTSANFGGQGARSTPGDATWIHTFWPDTFWASAGGDFAAASSASLSVGIVPGVYTWGSTPEMVADVQSWIDDPGGSFGWIILNNEVLNGTAKKFASKENEEVTFRPVLEVAFTTCGGDTDCDGDVDFNDLLVVLSDWGTYEPCPPYLSGDFDQNCAIDFTDLLQVLSNWGPCVQP